MKVLSWIGAVVLVGLVAAGAGVAAQTGRLTDAQFTSSVALAQAALAQLQSAAPPMAPSLAAEVVRSELGADPEEEFAEWEPVPVAGGTTLWFHSRTPHRSGPNTSSVARRALYPTYNARSEGDLRTDYYRQKLAEFAAEGWVAPALQLSSSPAGKTVGDQSDPVCKARRFAQTRIESSPSCRLGDCCSSVAEEYAAHDDLVRGPI